jgi:hypothetical protein
METILLITVSVLSTLGVAAIVLSIVNVLNRLKGKVDVETMNDIERSLREDIENNYRLIDRSVLDIHNRYDRKIEVLGDMISKVDKRVDSRSDKLVDHMCREFNVVHEKIDNKKDSSKSILQD